MDDRKIRNRYSTMYIPKPGLCYVSIMQVRGMGDLDLCGHTHSMGVYGIQPQLTGCDMPQHSTHIHVQRTVGVAM